MPYHRMQTSECKPPRAPRHGEALYQTGNARMRQDTPARDTRWASPADAPRPPLPLPHQAISGPPPAPSVGRGTPEETAISSLTAPAHTPWTTVPIRDLGGKSRFATPGFVQNEPQAHRRHRRYLHRTRACRVTSSHYPLGYPPVSRTFPRTSSTKIYAVERYPNDLFCRRP